MAMGAYPAVILAHFWLIAMEIPQKIDFLENMNGKFPEWKKMVTFRIKAWNVRIV